MLVTSYQNFVLQTCLTKVGLTSLVCNCTSFLWTTFIFINANRILLVNELLFKWKPTNVVTIQENCLDWDSVCHWSKWFYFLLMFQRHKMQLFLLRTSTSLQKTIVMFPIGLNDILLMINLWRKECTTPIMCRFGIQYYNLSALLHSRCNQRKPLIFVIVYSKYVHTILSLGMYQTWK